MGSDNLGSFQLSRIVQSERAAKLLKRPVVIDFVEADRDILRL